MYAGTSGALDDLPVKRLAEFEKELHDHIDNSHADIFEALRQPRAKLTDELRAKMDQAIKEFKDTFTA